MATPQLELLSGKPGGLRRTRTSCEVASRLGRPCGPELAGQTEFPELPVPMNTDLLDGGALGWSEAQAWEELVGVKQTQRLRGEGETIAMQIVEAEIADVKLVKPV